MREMRTCWTKKRKRRVVEEDFVFKEEWALLVGQWLGARL
jgi:hypothetical protein